MYDMSSGSTQSIFLGGDLYREVRLFLPGMKTFTDLLARRCSHICFSRQQVRSGRISLCGLEDFTFAWQTRNQGDQHWE